MEIVFLGTGSNNPTPTRNVSCTCLRLDGEIWLFDTGEATQIQLMRSTVKPGKITKIFITHLHGDHVFGLPGLMCTISQNVTDSKQPLELYGPVGLRRFIRVNLELSRSLVTYKYIVHEMIPLQVQIPDDIQKWNIIESENSYLHPSEMLGRNIEINNEGYWNLFENEKITIKSSWIKHRIPTFGFVIEQKPLIGKLNVDALKAKGVPAGPLYAKIKSGQIVQLPDGSTLDPKDFIGPSKIGKKICLLGDCQEISDQMLNLSKNSDVAIHEATLEDAFREKALSRGHSTPSMAANFANTINAKCLILNHFSQRYKPINYENKLNACKEDKKDPDDEDEIEDSVEKLLNEAKLTFKGDLYAAYDFFTYKI